MSPDSPAIKPASAYRINPENYAWYMALVAKLRDRVKLNIKVHGDKQLLRDGDVFLFNHFARLETGIPPFVIYEETGAYCHSITHYKLFEASDKLAKFMTDMGCLPSNLPDLLPEAARYILLGHKIVIYPEGGIIKDRRVMDDAGDYGIISDRDGKFRSLHKGAAVLAVTLDMFKARLKQLEPEQLAAWADKLGMKPDALRAAIEKPTVLVPATITFYPINIGSNIISRMAEFVMKKLPRQAMEEMVVEGNLILRDTDMDIRLGEPIVVQRESSFWQKLLLERGVGGLQSIDEYFELKDKPDAGMAEKIVAQMLDFEAGRIRDTYSERLYKGIMVNLSHLASRLMTNLVKANQLEVEAAYFQRALYLAIKGTQLVQGIYLHRSLANPERYRGVLQGDNPDLTKFMDMCEGSGLLHRAGKKYVLSPRLAIEPDAKVARQDNIIAVYANESAPLAGLREVVASALEEALDVGDKTLARLLFDDELRSYHWRKQFFAADKFKEINDKENTLVDGAPYLLAPRQGSGTGVLLVHGFRGSPAQLRGFGDKLLRDGHMVLGMRMAGHGTSPWDLHRRTWGEWLDSVRRAYRILASLNQRVVVVGFSTGAALGLYLASEKPARLAALVSVAAPLAVQDKNISYVPWISRLNRLVSKVTGNDGVVPFYKNEPDDPNVSYRALPVQAVQQLVELMAALPKRLPLIDAPVLVLQADGDPVVSPESAAQIFARLGSGHKVLEIIHGNRHGILNEDIGATQKLVRDFIIAAASAPAKPGE